MLSINLTSSSTLHPPTPTPVCLSILTDSSLLLPSTILETYGLLRRSRTASHNAREIRYCVCHVSVPSGITNTCLKIYIPARTRCSYLYKIIRIIFKVGFLFFFFFFFLYWNRSERQSVSVP